MLKGKVNSSWFVAMHIVAVAIPFNGLTGCGDGEEGKQPDPSVSEDAECVVVSNWVAENAGRLPTAYAELIRYPVAYRRGIFSALEPEAKSSLWKQHFEHLTVKRAVALPWKPTTLRAGK